MKKKLLLMLTLCLLAQWSVAQAPKWVDKAKRAVFSVVTYDQQTYGRMLPEKRPSVNHNRLYLLVRKRVQALRQPQMLQKRL